MAKKGDATVQVDGREVRVSSADRVIFPATERTPEITKLQVVEYYVVVGDGIMRALRERPTTLERWPKGVHEGMTISTREGHKGEAFYQKRVPKGAPDYLETARIEFPSGRSADEICPTELAVVAWCGHMGTITFHPWPVRRADVDHPDEMRIDLDPQEGTDFADAQIVAAEAKVLLEELGYRGFPKTSGGRGIHIYVRIEPKWTFTDVRHAVIAFGRELSRRMPDQVTTKWWKEERGEKVFIDYNQNARDRTIASPYSIRAKPGAPVSAPLLWDEVARSSPRTSRWTPCPRGSPRSATGSPRSTTCTTRWSRCWRCTSATRRATCPTRPTIRRCRASRSGYSPRGTPTARRSRELELEVLQTDITTLEVDAIANAANTELRHGGGVAAAIERAGGDAVRDRVAGRRADRPGRGRRDQRRRHALAVGHPRGHDGAGRAHVRRRSSSGPPSRRCRWPNGWERGRSGWWPSAPAWAASRWTRQRG